MYLSLVLFALLGACATPPANGAHAACLAKADSVDGKADRVIERCPGCGLAMPGDPQHASAAGEYTVHSCSETCKQAFDADPIGLVARSCKD